jgi:MFS family permease
MTNRSANSTATEAAESLLPHGWALAIIVAGLLLTLALSALDATIVGTALPTIAGALHGFEQYSWVVTAYLLTSTTVVPIVGKLSDQFGRKGFLLMGIALFLLGSALALSLEHVFLVTFGVGIAVLIITFFLKDVRLRKRGERMPAQATQASATSLQPSNAAQHDSNA